MAGRRRRTESQSVYFPCSTKIVCQSSLYLPNVYQIKPNLLFLSLSERAPVLEKVERKRNQRNERGVTGSLNNKKRGHTVPYGQRQGEQQSNNKISAVCQLLIFPDRFSVHWVLSEKADTRERENDLISGACIFIIFLAIRSGRQ